MSERPGRLSRRARRARAWLLVSVLALLGVLLLAGFPARAWVAQRHERETVAAAVSEMAAQNRRLEDQARLLQTDAEIERLARKDYNLVRPGEEPFAILPSASPAPAPVATPGAGATEAEAEPPWWRRALTRLTDVF
jgi:cell division protein FtsB